MISMLRAGILGTLLILAPALALAGEHRLPSGKPVVSITVPDNWQTSADTHSVSTMPADGEVHVSVMLVSMGEFTHAMKFWEDSMGEMKITRDEFVQDRAEIQVRRRQFHNLRLEGQGRERTCKACANHSEAQRKPSAVRDQMGPGSGT